MNTQNLSDATEQVALWVGRGRYIRQKALRPFDKLAGVVVHDDGNELFQAALSSDLDDPQPLEFGTRFNAWVLRRGGYHVDRNRYGSDEFSGAAS